MGTKNYSINRRKDGKVIYEVDGALYADLAQVPEESDRAMLAAMQDGSFERGSEKDFGAGMDAGARAADTARTRMIFPGIFLGIAVLMLLVAGVSSYSVISQVNREVRAPGSVVDTVVQQAGENSVFSYPVVAFADRDGKNHTVQVSEGSSPPQWAVGDAVIVRYDPAYPEGARIESFTSDLLLWLLPGITGIVGIGFLLAVLLVTRVMPPEIR